MKFRLLGIAIAIVAFASHAGLAQRVTPVTSLAGNGSAGNVDGPGRSAEFMDPVDVAVDPASGAIYVADFAGQRIRRVDRDGDVTTAAGTGAVAPSGLSVEGARVDGPVATARFDGPSGVAVTAAGDVEVADALDHCVRLISNGVVSTLAGDPARVGGQDGPLGTASFTYPRGIAVARDGTTYVADATVGVRAIGRGAVTTLAIPDPYGKNVTGLALLAGPRPALFGAVRPGVWRYDLTSHAFAIVTTSARLPAAFGPFGVVPIDYDRAVATSVFLDGLFLATYPGFRGHKDSRSLQIAGASEKDQSFAGGFSDDVPERALFFAPSGIARDAAGDLIVADRGNRRIRIVPAEAVTTAGP